MCCLISLWAQEDHSSNMTNVIILALPDRVGLMSVPCGPLGTLPRFFDSIAMRIQSPQMHRRDPRSPAKWAVSETVEEA